MNTKGIRYTHPLSRIGKRFVGTIGPSLAGKVYTESVHGPLGHEVQAAVPVDDARGKVVGLVSAGLKVKNVTSEVNRQLPIILGAGAGALVVSAGVTALVGRRLNGETRSLAPDEMTRMYDHHDTVLHSVREGVLIVAGDGRLLLANDEANGCWSCPPTPRGGSCRSCRASNPRWSCSSPGARPPTRCTSPGNGCWRSTSGPPGATEASRERW